MPSLARYLQVEFPKHISSDWICTHERNFLSEDLVAYLGYRPRADILLEKNDSSRRLWIEFEISRADPVANHVKFATAHLFQPQERTDTFISMASSHIASGRRNLAENTILLMRHLGMDAFHLALLPMYSAQEIRNLNHLPINLLSNLGINVSHEIERIFNVVEPVYRHNLHSRIHFAGDLTEVLRNLRRWNKDIRSNLKQPLWGKRTITYFVYDPQSANFAPSKFCAYVPVVSYNSYPQNLSGSLSKPEMDLEIYQSIETDQKIFDGKRAREHLNHCLCMQYQECHDNSRMSKDFENWLSRHSESIGVHPQGPKFLTFPEWFI